MEPLLSEQPNDVGDLYLDVAEAFMEVGDYKQAKPILASLVHSENYNLVSTVTLQMFLAKFPISVSRENNSGECYLFLEIK